MPDGIHAELMAQYAEDARESERPQGATLMFTDREWFEAKCFGQYEQRENREEVVVFRREDLCAYITMLREYDAAIRNAEHEQ